MFSENELKTKETTDAISKLTTKELGGSTKAEKRSSKASKCI
jgi:hypothetical protein